MVHKNPPSSFFLGSNGLIYLALTIKVAPKQCLKTVWVITWLSAAQWHSAKCCSPKSEIWHTLHLFKWLGVTCISATVHLPKCKPLALIQVTSLTAKGPVLRTAKQCTWGAVWLTASSMRRMVLPIFITFCDAQNRSNNCSCHSPIHLVLIPTKIHCIHFVSMNFANISSLQMWPVLDAVSLWCVLFS